MKKELITQLIELGDKHSEKLLNSLSETVLRNMLVVAKRQFEQQINEQVFA